MKDLHDIVIANIRRLAKSKGLSNERLADFAGTSGGYLSEILRKKKSPSLRTIEKIAEGLDVDAVVLFERDPG
jgi:transcriptional regulator with XRE-family HTH domain